MNLLKFYKECEEHLQANFTEKNENDLKKLPLELFQKRLHNENIQIASCLADNLFEWATSRLFMLAVAETLTQHKNQKIMDMLYAAYISFLARDRFIARGAQRMIQGDHHYNPSSLFMLMCISYYLGYQKGYELFKEKLSESGFFDNLDGNGRWSVEFVSGDYLALVCNLHASLVEKKFLVSRPGSLYDAFFEIPLNESSLDKLCELRLKLGKAEKKPSDLNCPFSYLAHTVMPYEVLCIQKLYRETHNEDLPVTGKFTRIMDAWLSPNFKTGFISDQTSLFMINELNKKFDVDFQSMAFD